MNSKPRFGVDGAAAVHEFYMIHCTNTRAARDNITFFAFHTFLVEVQPGPNYMTAAHAFVIVTLRLGLRALLVARNETNCCLLLRYDGNHSLAMPQIPYCSSFVTRILCLTVSKALLCVKSRNIPQE